MNTAVPGVEPWEEVKRNPYIWHFAFFAIPELPENILMGKQRVLFDYFFNSITANQSAIDDSKRDYYVAAYNTPSSFKTGLDWYRSFNQDEKENSTYIPVNIPVLYLRGEKNTEILCNILKDSKRVDLAILKENSFQIADTSHPKKRQKKLQKQLTIL